MYSPELREVIRLAQQYNLIPIVRDLLADTETPIRVFQHFYEEKMQTAEWELLGVLDTSGANTGEAYSLWFSKDQDVVTIEIFMKENTTHVFIRLE